jgi:hypothetical protein
MGRAEPAGLPLPSLALKKRGQRAASGGALASDSMDDDLS